MLAPDLIYPYRAKHPKVRGRNREEHSNSIPAPSRFSPHLRIFLLSFLVLAGTVLFVFFRLMATTWDGNLDQNMVLVPTNIDGFKGRIIYAHISPSTNKILAVSFPAEMELEVIGGYGKYPFRSLYPLAQLEKKDIFFVQAAYSLALENTIDQVWTSNEARVFAEPIDVKRLAQELLFYKIASPWTLSDRVRFYQLVHRLRPDQVTVTTISDMGQWQALSAKIAYPSEARDCSISVVNSTKIAGMGARVGSVFERSGFSVIRVTDQSTPLEKSSILTSNPEECANILQHVPHVLPFASQVKTDPNTLSQYRSPIVVILGQDIGEKLQRK